MMLEPDRKAEYALAERTQLSSGGRGDLVRGSDHAGVRPCRRMTSPIAAKSGGPPADAARTSLISEKYEGPNRPGLMIARNLASSLPWFAKPWTTPRGMQMVSPGPISVVSPSTV